MTGDFLPAAAEMVGGSRYPFPFEYEFGTSAPMAEFKITELPISGLLLIEPQIFGDERGYFKESFRVEVFEKAGIPAFVQENESLSRKGVLRGLHFQVPPHAQGKLVRCALGSVFDVAVDIRKGSPTYGQWYGLELTEKNHLMMYIPPGFAHGFCTLSEQALFCYKQTNYYAPNAEGAVLWNDPQIGIEWPMTNPLVSDKDKIAQPLAELDSAFVFSANEGEMK